MYGGLLLVALLLPAADDPKVKAELAKAQGTWAIESVEHDGKDVSDEIIRQLFKSGQVVVTGDKLSVVAGDVKLVETTLVLDPSTKPKCIDFKALQGPVYEAEVIEGVYELDRDNAKVCVYVQR